MDGITKEFIEWASVEEAAQYFAEREDFESIFGAVPVSVRRPKKSSYTHPLEPHVSL